MHRDGDPRPADDPPGLDAALAALEADRGIEVVAARDLGSHAWNLADPDSDHDVAVAFRQPAVEYATLDGYVESVEAAPRPGLELSGWNVRRFGELLVDSNPTILEFLHSPLRYRDPPAVDELARDVADRFEPIAVYYHYRSLAASNYRRYVQRRLLVGGDPEWVVVDEADDEWVVRPVGDDRDRPGECGSGSGSTGTDRVPKDDEFEVATTDRTVKRNLHVARGALYARFVRDTHRFPDLDFPAFLDAEGSRFPEAVVRTARALVERKRSGEGDAVVGDAFGPGIVPPERVDPADHAVRGIDRDRVDRFLRSVVE
jgi:hypothetical protein